MKMKYKINNYINNNYRCNNNNNFSKYSSNNKIKTKVISCKAKKYII